MTTIRALAALGIAAALAACDTSVSINGPDGELRRSFHWEGTVEVGSTVEVRGVNGSIRAQPASGRTLIVHATIHGSAVLASQVDVQVVEHEDGITVCARYPDRRGRLIACLPDRDSRIDVEARNVRVEFTIDVPDGVTFLPSTVNGEVTADLQGDIVAATVNGNVNLVTEGIAEAATVNGSIAVSLGGTNWGRNLSFTTVNGSIRVAIPDGCDVRVEGSTLNGRISTDFPLTITRDGVVERLRGSLGAGTWNLLLTTVNGDIALRERG